MKENYFKHNNGITGHISVFIDNSFYKTLDIPLIQIAQNIKNLKREAKHIGAKVYHVNKPDTKYIRLSTEKTGNLQEKLSLTKGLRKIIDSYNVR